MVALIFTDKKNAAKHDDIPLISSKVINHTKCDYKCKAARRPKMKVVILLLKAVKRIPASPEKPSIMAQLTFSSPQVDFRRRQLVF